MTAHDPRVTLTEAEVERLLRDVLREQMDAEYGEEGWHEFGSLRRIAKALHQRVVEPAIAARLAPIRALAEDPIEECEVHTRIADGCEECSVVDALHWYAGRLRAALDAPVSASQDHDGAEGQGEGEWSRRVWTGDRSYYYADEETR